MTEGVAVGGMESTSVTKARNMGVSVKAVPIMEIACSMFEGVGCRMLYGGRGCVLVYCLDGRGEGVADGIVDEVDKLGSILGGGIDIDTLI